ncbi:MAG: hypothetical protein DRJ34_03055 [Thermoprotei archaeon]|nr:MAG: hypothetical protein DRJ34_03055 [Thermoprotei archaeon]
MKTVVDTRFLVEYFYTKDKRVKEKIIRKFRELVSRNKGILPTIVISEIIKITCKRRGIDEAEARYHFLLQVGFNIAYLTPEIAKEAGILKCKYENIPIGDCIIASIAKRYGAKILSDDPHFNIIKEVEKEWI